MPDMSCDATPILPEISNPAADPSARISVMLLLPLLLLLCADIGEVRIPSAIVLCNADLQEARSITGPPVPEPVAQLSISSVD